MYRVSILLNQKIFIHSNNSDYFGEQLVKLIYDFPRLSQFLDMWDKAYTTICEFASIS